MLNGPACAGVELTARTAFTGELKQRLELFGVLAVQLFEVGEGVRARGQRPCCTDYAQRRRVRMGAAVVEVFDQRLGGENHREVGRSASWCRALRRRQWCAGPSAPTARLSCSTVMCRPTGGRLVLCLGGF